MSSVVNKSKNRFAPKAKARPRPGVTQAAPPALVPTVSPSKHIEESIKVAAPKSSAPGIRGSTPTPVRAERQLKHVIDQSEIPEPPAPPRGGISTLHASITVVIPHASPASEEENHTESRPRGVIPALRAVNEEGDHTGPAPRSQRIPTIRSSSLGIPTILSSMPEVSATRSTTSEEEPVAKKSQPAKTKSKRTQNKGKGSQLGVTEGQDQLEELDEVVGRSSTNEPEPAQQPKKKPAPKRKAKAVPSGEPFTKRKATARKNQSDIAASSIEDGPGQPLEGEAVEETVGGASTAPKVKKQRRVSTKAKPKTDPKTDPKPRGRRRAESPEDGESQEIAVNVVKMRDLCRDMKIGKKSKRFMELQQIDWKKVAKEQHERAEAEERIISGEEEGGHETVEERLERLANERGRRTMNAPQMRIVNGQIVLDDESLQIDRRERDAVDEGVMEVVEENQNSRLVNSQTWSRREKVEKWDTAATERFYEALSMFGTDFEIISRMFVGRSRRQMRNKFNNEERKHPEKITAALRTRISVNIEEYSQMADQVFQDPQDLENELLQLREAHEADELVAAGHAVAMEKERQEVANAAMHESDNAAAAEQGKKTRKRKGAKSKTGVNLGEEVLTMTREEYEAERLRELAEADGL